VLRAAHERPDQAISIEKLDDFSRDNLPTLVVTPSREHEAALATVHSDYAFVYQMRWVQAPDLIWTKPSSTQLVRR
jgi:hypothetical protein